MRKELALGIIFFLLIPGIILSNGQNVGEKSILSPSKGNILYVGGGGSGNYTRIQDALNDSKTGDTIYVYNDSSPYYEHLVIQKSVFLIGEDKFSTEINGSLLENTLDTVNVAGDNVVIEGFRIASNQGYYYQAALKVVGDYLTVSNCSIYDNEWIGIYLVSASFCKIIDCELYENLMALNLVNSRNNIIMNCSFYDNAEGITLFQSSDHNQILHCMSNRNSFTGIHIQQSSENQITDCLCQDGYGISLAGAPQTKMRNNTLLNNYVNFGIGSSYVSDFYCDIDTSNTINGKPMYFLIGQNNLFFDETMDIGYLGLVNCHNISVKNHVFSNNFAGMVIVGSSDSFIENCSFTNNEGHGMYIISSLNNTVKNCTFRDGFFDGILLYNSSYITVEKCSSYDSTAGVRLEFSTHNTLHEQTVDQCTIGILFISSSSNILKDSRMSHCGLKVDGRSLEEYLNDVDTSNTVNGKPVYYCINETNRVIPSDAGEVVLVNCTDCTVSNLILSDTSIAIELAYSSTNRISHNTLRSNSDAAIDLDGSDNDDNIIEENMIQENSYGIDVDSSEGTIIQGNVLLDSGPGFSFDSSHGSTIIGNTIQNCYYGMYFVNSPLNTLSDNIILNASVFGLYFLTSSKNVLRSNTMIDCSLMVYGNALTEYFNDVDTSNTVNGKPLYYLMNQIDRRIPEEAGEVLLINSSGCTIQNLHLDTGTVGITLAYSSQNMIRGNIIKNQSQTGIDLSSGYSDNNSIQGNTIQRNGYGIDIEYCTGSALKYNTISSNGYGVLLYNAVDTMIKRNTIVKNYVGIDAIQTTESTIRLNNIFLNSLYGLSADACSVSAPWNWWGALTGPAVNGDRNGDHLNGIHNAQIIYVPWHRLPVLFTGILRLILTNSHQKNSIEHQVIKPDTTFFEPHQSYSDHLTIHGMKNLRITHQQTVRPIVVLKQKLDSQFSSHFL
jgi:parallel beta-helix repeat protein